MKIGGQNRYPHREVLFINNFNVEQTVYKYDD